jgi:hypothetical protein
MFADKHYSLPWRKTRLYQCRRGDAVDVFFSKS